MNRCMQLDRILQEHVSRPPPEPYWISRLWVKGQGHRTVFLDSLPLWDRANKFISTITH